MGSGFDIASMGISSGIDLFKLVYGLTQTIGGNKQLNQLEDSMPKYQIDKGITDNKNIAAQTASQGFGDATKNYYGDVIERGLGSTIQAGLQTGQGLEFVNNAFGNANDAYRSFLAQDAQQKIQNQQILFDANKDLRDENLRAFDYNENIPWQMKYNRATQKTNAGAQNIFGGGMGVGADVAGLGDAAGGSSDSASNGWLQYMLKNYGG